MRYKDQTLNLLEQLHNNFSQLEYMMRQGATREQVLQWIEMSKSKIEQAQVYINRESEE